MKQSGYRDRIRKGMDNRTYKSMADLRGRKKSVAHKKQGTRKARKFDTDLKDQLRDLPSKG